MLAVRRGHSTRGPNEPILPGMKPVKRSIALLIEPVEERSGDAEGSVAEAPRSVAGPARNGRAGGFLLVRRPPDDEDLPDAWGLPAGSLREGESWEDAVRRAGREKLGVSLRPGPLLREGEIERAGYRLRMRLYAAEVEQGEPRVPQAVAGVTQYVALTRGPLAKLEPAARAGSLCSTLALAWADGA